MAVLGDLHIPKLVAVCVSEKSRGIGFRAGYGLVRPRSSESAPRYYNHESIHPFVHEMNSPSPTIQEQASEILRTLPARISDVVAPWAEKFARQPCFG